MVVYSSEATQYPGKSVLQSKYWIAASQHPSDDPYIRVQGRNLISYCLLVSYSPLVRYPPGQEPPNL